MFNWEKITLQFDFIDYGQARTQNERFINARQSDEFFS